MLLCSLKILPDANLFIKKHFSKNTKKKLMESKKSKQSIEKKVVKKL